MVDEGSTALAGSRMSVAFVGSSQRWDVVASLEYKRRVAVFEQIITMNSPLENRGQYLHQVKVRVLTNRDLSCINDFALALLLVMVESLC
jgi:hypothetical protein